MKGNYYLLLIFPVSILIAGFVVLRLDLYPGKNVVIPLSYVDSTVIQSRQLDTARAKDMVNNKIAQTTTRTIVKKEGSTQLLKTRQEHNAMPYFILAAVFVVVILALPRLQELSISEKSIVLKLFNEVKQAAADLEEESTGAVGLESTKGRFADKKLLVLQERIKMVDKVLNKG